MWTERGEHEVGITYTSCLIAQEEFEFEGACLGAGQPEFDHNVYELLLFLEDKTYRLCEH